MKLDLTISNGFIQKFLKRNNFVIRKINSTKKNIVNSKIIHDFKIKIKNLIDSGTYDYDHVINFDQTHIQKD